MKNKYEINGDTTIVYITQRNGNEHKVYIDTEDLPKLIQLKSTWVVGYKKKIKGYYCQATEYLGVVDGKQKNRTLFLHRFITNAPKGSKVDHRNHNTTLLEKEMLVGAIQHKNG